MRADPRNMSRTHRHIHIPLCTIICQFQRQVITLNNYNNAVIWLTFHYVNFFYSDHDTEMNGVEEGYYPNGSPYRIQRHAANIRERKRMLR